MTDKLSLRIKLVLVIATVLTVMSTGMTIYKLMEFESEREESLNQHVQRLGDAIASALSTPIWEYDTDSAIPTLEAMRQDKDFVRGVVIDDTGKVFCEVKEPSRLGDESLIEYSKDVIAAPSTGRGGQKIGEVRLTFSRERLLNLRHQSLRTDLLSLLILLLAMLGVVSLTIRAFTRPIVDMTELMERRGQGDYDSEVSEDYTQRGDEIGAIARSLERDQRRRRDEYHMLNLTGAIAQELDLDLLLPMIASTATDLLDAERSSIFLYDDTKNVLWSRVAEGVDTVLEVAVDEGVAGAVFRTRERINIPDVTKDKRFSVRTDHRTGFVTRDLLCEPLITQEGNCIGVIQVLNRAQGIIAERGEKLLAAFAAQTVVAIEKARLFRDVVVMKNFNESILNSLSDGVISMDPSFTVTKANPAACSIFHLDGQKLVGSNVRRVTTEDKWIHRSLEKVRDSGRPDITLDQELVLNDGENVSVNASTLQLFGEEGEGSGFMLILSDISAEKRVRGTMARYLPKEVIEQLLESEEGKLGGTAQKVTTLFSDIRSFTTISESIGPRATVALLNEYFTEMIEVLESHDGILDKYIGDAVMAIFGAPFTSEKDASNAVAAANAMILTLDRLNGRRRKRGELDLAIGVGLNTGEVVVGNIGSPKRMDYTVIGDPVNLAARLEGVTKIYGAAIVLSQFTYDELEDKSGLRELDLIRVKGKVEPVPIYECYRYKSESATQAFFQGVEAYNQGLAAYRAQEWAEGKSFFEQALKLNPSDKTAALYLERTAQCMKKSPPPDWDGVFTLKTK